MSNQLKNDINQLLKNLKKEQFNQDLKTIRWVLIQLICNLIITFNRGFRFLLCVIDSFSKYAWVAPLKNKKGGSIANAFQKILDKSGRKTNKIWIDKGSEFYNNSFKKWLKDNNIEM